MLIKNEAGYLAIGAAIALVLLGLLGLGLNSLVSSSSARKANIVSKIRSHLNAHTAMERALARINAGEDPETGGFALGPEASLIVSVAPPTITATGLFHIAKTTYHFDATGENGPQFAGDCLTLDCGNLHFAGNQLTTYKFRKSDECPETPVMTEMKITWDPDDGERTKEIQINGTEVYNELAGSASAEWIDIIDYQIPDSPVTPVNHYEFTADPISIPKDFTFEIRFKDQSILTASCPNVN